MVEWDLAVGGFGDGAVERGRGVVEDAVGAN